MGPRDIARHAKLSVQAVERSRARLRQKIGLPDAAALTRYAMRWVEFDSAADSPGPPNPALTDPNGGRGTEQSQEGQSQCASRACHSSAQSRQRNKENRRSSISTEIHAPAWPTNFPSTTRLFAESAAAAVADSPIRASGNPRVTSMVVRRVLRRVRSAIRPPADI